MSEPRWSIAAARMMPRSSAQASMPFALPLVTRALVSTAISVTPCALFATHILRSRGGSDRRRLRYLGGRSGHHAARHVDSQRERHRDDAEDRRRDEHEVVVAEDRVEVAAGVGR